MNLWRSCIHSLCLTVAALALLTFTGCTEIRTEDFQSAGELSAANAVGQELALPDSFQHGFYQHQGRNGLTILLVDGPLENPRQFMTIRMLWRPRAARTPISRDATNASIRHVIFTEDGAQVGIYSGGGFLWPKGKPGAATMKASIWNASLKLSNTTEGFPAGNLLSEMEGSFSLQRDDAGVDQALRQLNVLLRQRLGYPYLVRAADADATVQTR